MNLGAVMAVHAHPDDESINNSGLLALAARSHSVTVVTCTRGEEGEVIPPDLADLVDDRLAFGAYRAMEIAQAMAALAPPGRPQDGPDQVFLDALPLPGESVSGRVLYHDSGMEWVPGHEGVLARGAPHRSKTAFVDVDLDKGATRLAALIRDRRPGLLVTYEPGGGYGHPDHVRTHQVAMRAYELAAEDDLDLDGLPSWQVPQLWWTVVPRNVYLATRAEHYAQARAETTPIGPGGDRLIPGDPDGPVPALVDGAPGHLIRLDTAGVLPQRIAALMAYATQLQGVRLLPQADPARQHRGGEVVGEYALSNAILQPILRHEYYREVGVNADANESGGVAGATLQTEAEVSLTQRRKEAARVVPMETARPRWLLAAWFVPMFLLGAVAGIFGTLMHRSLPVGMLCALASVVLSATIARAIVGQSGLAGVLAGWFSLVFVLATFGPGGDVAIAGDTVGYLWIFGGIVSGLAVAFFPRRWFSGKG